MFLLNHTKILLSGVKIRETGFFCFLFSLLFFISCSNHHCKEPMFVPLVVSFYSEADTSLQVSPQFLMINGVDVSRINSVQLFLKKFEESSEFLFAYDSTQSKTDRLTIKHTNTQIFVSAECGCLTTFYLDELRHTNNNITDAIIIKKSVTSNYNEKHIRIYFENY